MTTMDRPAIARQLRELLIAWHDIPGDGEDRARITTAEGAVGLLEASLCGLEQEEFWIVLLDTKNHVLETTCLYRGSINTIRVRPAEVFKEAIRHNAAGIIVAHNHPSGDPAPSPEDVRLTKDLVEAGKLLDLPVLDHIIIGRGRYISLKQRGLGFSTT